MKKNVLKIVIAIKRLEMKSQDIKTIVSLLKSLETLFVPTEENVGFINALILDAADRLECLTTEVQRLRAERRWIPVEERLPDEDVPVLCIDSRGVQMVAWSGWGEWYGPEIEADITHWMPLPPLQDQFGEITKKENE
jgi:hypothetical protein